MSDISKSAELHARLEARREFRFESGLARYMRQTMYDNEKTLSEVAKGTGLTAAQVSDYRSDYKLLNANHAIRLSKYFTKITGEEIPADMMIYWQQQGYMVNLEEGRQKMEAFFEGINRAVKYG